MLDSIQYVMYYYLADTGLGYIGLSGGQDFARGMLGMRPENPSEMEKLLMKYSNGSVPPLVAEDDGSGQGLLSEELLDIFQKGFSATYSIPLCISVVPGGHLSRKRRSATRETSVHYGSEYPFPSCQYLQMIRGSAGERDIEQASASMPEELSPSGCEYFITNPELITQSRETRAYMCSVGMLGPAVPVCVADEIIAVLSSECKKPKSGAIWPKYLVTYDRCSSSVISGPSTAAKTDLWQESKRRIRKCEEILRLEPGELLGAIAERVETDSNTEMSPEDLETMIDALENAGTYLTEMADKTYRLEKESVMGWIRAEMASALSSVDTFWSRIQQSLGHLARLVGADYILLIAREKSHASSLDLQCQYGLPEESLPALEYDWAGSLARVDDFVERIGNLEHGVEIDLEQYRDVPILGTLYSLYGKGVSYPVFAAPTTTLNSGLTLIVLGKERPTATRRSVAQSKSGGAGVGTTTPVLIWLRDGDRRYLTTIVREMAIVISVFSSMRRFQETEEEQTNLMESVSHDLRTPIQNIMIAAENLREGRVDPERASRTITGVVTQLQRLDLLAQKAWTLERIRQDKLVYSDEQVVAPHLIFAKCKELLIDMAERASIDIHIDPDVERWQAVHLDAEMFTLVVMNLLQNGIKYSFPNTRIRIGGWQDDVGASTSITFENEGIHIHDEERDRIFDRYFRSKDAIGMDPAGSGIGLALVKEFVDHYGGRIDVRSTEVGFGKYLNVFSLFLPRR